ncbi:MAG TPA: hypothetical protein VIM85_00120 [Pseudomonadales bacterium]
MLKEPAPTSCSNAVLTWAALLIQAQILLIVSVPSLIIADNSGLHRLDRVINK